MGICKRVSNKQQIYFALTLYIYYESHFPLYSSRIYSHSTQIRGNSKLTEEYLCYNKLSKYTIYDKLYLYVVQKSVHCILE